MDSRLEAHIDEIFQDVPKTDKMVTMINRIKSKANAKYLQIKDQGFSRTVAYNEVDDWIMKAKVIIDEEVGKLTPAEIAAAPKTAPKKAGKAVSEANIGDMTAVVVEKDDEVNEPYSAPEPEPVAAPAYEAYQAAPEEADQAVAAPVFEAPAQETAYVAPTPAKKAEKPAKVKKGKKGKKVEIEEEEIVVPVPKTGKVGYIIGGICLVAGIVLIIIAVLILIGII